MEGAIALAEQDTIVLLNGITARAPARALFGAFAVGSCLSALLAGAYVAGGAARAGDDHNRLRQIASTGHTTSDRQALRQAMPADVLTIAERYDPSLVPAAQGRNPWAGALPQPQDGDSALVQKTVLTAPAAATPFVGRTNTSDADCLATAVYYEARGEGQAGQAAVAQVILNRVRHPSFPKSICGVVYQRAAGDCQFSFVCNGAMAGRRESAAWARARRVADRALGGFVMSGVGNAVSFHATRVAPSWGGMIRVAQVGQHVFYSFGGRPGVMRTFPSAPPAVAVIRTADVHPAYKVLGPNAHPAEPKLILASSTGSSAPARVAETPSPKTAAPAGAQAASAVAAAAPTQTVMLASVS